MEEIKVSEMLQADSISKDDSVMIIQSGVNKKASGSETTATGTSISLTSVADTCKIKSNSKNVFNQSQITNPNTGTSATIVLTLKPNTEYTCSTNCPTSTGSSSTLIFFASGTSSSGLSTDTNGVWDGQTRTFTSDSNGNMVFVYRRLSSDTNVDLTSYWYQIEEGSTATAYNPYNTEIFVGSKNLKVTTNVVNGYISPANQNISSSITSKTTYIEIEPNTTYCVAKALVSGIFRIALADTTPAVNVSVSQAQDISGNSIAIYNDSHKYLVVTYKGSTGAPEEEAMANLIISKDLQKLNLLAGEEKTAFTYNEETSISSNGSVTATYSTKGRLLNNDDTLAIKEYVDREMSNEYNINLAYTTIASTYQFFKSNGIATITAGNIWIGASLSANSWLDIGTIPSACIPKTQISFSTAISDGYNGRVISYGKGSVTTDGKIRVMVGSALTSQNTLGLNFSVTYLTN